jgi:hypothetical protein
VVDGAQDPNIVVAPGGGANDVVVAVNHLHDLADAEWHELDFISSPSKSALYGLQTDSLNPSVLQGIILAP